MGFWDTIGVVGGGPGTLAAGFGSGGDWSAGNLARGATPIGSRGLFWGGKGGGYSLPSFEDAPNLTIDPNMVGKTSDQYLEKARSYGGPSAWAGFENRRIGSELSKMSDEAAQRAGGQAASARTTLGMRGGLTGGAAERLARNAANQSFRGQQDLAQLGTQQRAGTMARDYGVQQAQTNTWAQMQADEQRRREAIEMANQQAKAQMWGANQMAQAQLAQANKPDRGLIGGLLGDIF